MARTSANTRFFSELSPLLRDGNAPRPSSVVTPVSSTVVLDEAALRGIPPALRVHQDSVVRPTDLGPQALLIQARVLPRPTVRKFRLHPRPASAAFTFSDGPAVISSVGAHFVSDLPSPSRRCWQAPSRREFWFRSIGFYSTNRPATSPHRAKIGPASERLPFTGFSRALHRPRAYCADRTRQRCGYTCSVFAWFPHSRNTLACQHLSRSLRDAITGRNRVHRVCRAIIAH